MNDTKFKMLVLKSLWLILRALIKLGGIDPCDNNSIEFVIGLGVESDKLQKEE